MTSYKRDVLESFRSKDGQRLSNLWKSAEYFKNNVPQCQIAKALQISSSTVHNIIKRFTETREISVCKGLLALRQHWNYSVIDITKWAQE